MSERPQLPAWKFGRSRGLLDQGDVRKLETEGWAFSDGGIPVGDSWALWATRPDGTLELVWLAHPEFHPAAWPEESEAAPVNQLELFA